MAISIAMNRWFDRICGNFLALSNAKLVIIQNFNFSEDFL